ncbi:MAG: ATP-binding protein, partial [Gammaproteobacteria bacterium]|nr:ATP-binding protein [Gammaproteobacteria bacterium]
VERAVATTAEVFRERAAQVHVQLPDAVPLLHADPDRILQVMLNLLSNAAKFMAKESGRVEIHLRKRKDMYKVSVADNGRGIPLELQPVIFQKFRQGIDGSANPMGTGLGLPISREIIEHFGGRLAVKSAPEKGAIFSFVLPCSPGGSDILSDNPVEEADT